MKTMIFAGLMLAFTSSVSAQTPPVPGEGKIPQDVSARVYVGDTGTYDVLLALGKLAEVDRSNNVIKTYIDVSHFRCDPSVALKTKVSQMPNTTAYSFTLDKEYSGSISVFTANAQMSDKERQRVLIDDVATADLSYECQLNRQSIARLLSGMKGMAGKRIFYVTGAMMSRLLKEVYSESEWGGGVSAGSWLSLSGKGYKGSGKMDAVPVITVRGYYIDVPSDKAKVLSAISEGDVPLVNFSTTLDLGISDKGTPVNSRTPD